MYSGKQDFSIYRCTYKDEMLGVYGDEESQPGFWRTK
jgi:hypothetical protein